MSLIQGDARAIPLAEGCVQCVVTSPPYWGLRDYGQAGQIGLEQTPDAYVAALVAVFREVWRVLRDDGVLWLNLGDAYAHASSGGCGAVDVRRDGRRTTPGDQVRGRMAGVNTLSAGLKPKDLVGIPWRVAFALQADGWYLRSDIIWHKPNPMPESVTDRPTKAHEYVFLLTKSERYAYHADAVREPHADTQGVDRFAASGGNAPNYQPDTQGWAAGGKGMRMRPGARAYNAAGRNARTVWTIATQPYSGAHFATFPEALVERCVLAGSRVGERVFDPFGGSGTVARVALSLGRKAVCTELNPAYLALADERTQVTLGLPLEFTA